TGATAWQRRMAGVSGDEGDSILVDSSGVYIAGHFSGAIDLDPSTAKHTLTSAGAADGFFLKFDANGHYLFAKQFGSTGDDRIESLARKSNGDIVLAGSFSGTVDFNPAGVVMNATSAGGVDAFVLELDSQGRYQSLQTYGSTGDDRARGV